MLKKLILIATILFLPVIAVAQINKTTDLCGQPRGYMSSTTLLCISGSKGDKAACEELIQACNIRIEEYNQKIKEIENDEFFLLHQGTYLQELSFAYSKRSFAKKVIGDYKGAIKDKTKQIQNVDLFITSLRKRNEATYSKGTEILIESMNISRGNHYFSRGDLYSKLSDYRAAMQDFNKAIQLNPDNTNAIAYRGNAKYQLGDYRGAILDYDKAIEQSPSFASYYYSRGLAKVNIGHKDSGCLDLSKAGELGIIEAYDAIKEYCQ